MKWSHCGLVRVDAVEIHTALFSQHVKNSSSWQASYNNHDSWYSHGFSSRSDPTPRKSRVGRQWENDETLLYDSEVEIMLTAKNWLNITALNALALGSFGSSEFCMFTLNLVWALSV